MITVFGSVNIDLIFMVDQMPQPGAGQLSPFYQMMPGGKGANQAIAAAHAGTRVQIAGAVGADSFGDVCRESLEAAGVDCRDLWSVHNPTGCASICVDRHGASMIVIAQGANGDAKASDLDLQSSK